MTFRSQSCSYPPIGRILNHDSAWRIWPPNWIRVPLFILARLSCRPGMTLVCFDRCGKSNVILMQMNDYFASALMERALRRLARRRVVALLHLALRCLNVGVGGWSEWNRRNRHQTRAHKWLQNHLRRFWKWLANSGSVNFGTETSDFARFELVQTIWCSCIWPAN